MTTIDCAAFAAKRTILLAEEDSVDEDNGSRAGSALLKTPTIDAQGAGRLQSRRNPYRTAETRAAAPERPSQ